MSSTCTCNGHGHQQNRVKASNVQSWVLSLESIGSHRMIFLGKIVHVVELDCAKVSWEALPVVELQLAERHPEWCQRHRRLWWLGLALKLVIPSRISGPLIFGIFSFVEVRQCHSPYITHAGTAVLRNSVLRYWLFGRHVCKWVLDQAYGASPSGRLRTSWR